MRRKTMWFWVIVLILVGGIVYGLSFWQTSSGVKPPLPTVKVGSVTAEVKQSTYCWANGDEAVCEDHALPEPDDLQIVTVEPGATIDVSFHEAPDNETFHQIVDGEVVPAERIVPSEPGVYLFETGGDWANGDSRYVFGVEVTE